MLQPNGILYFTTQGAAFKEKLLPSELSVFDSGHIVVIGDTKEGHRTFTAFQPFSYIQELISGYFSVITYREGKKTGNSIAQDVWILKKI